MKNELCAPKMFSLALTNICTQQKSLTFYHVFIALSTMLTKAIPQYIGFRLPY